MKGSEWCWCLVFLSDVWDHEDRAVLKHINRKCSNKVFSKFRYIFVFEIISCCQGNPFSPLIKWTFIFTMKTIIKNVKWLIKWPWLVYLPLLMVNQVTLTGIFTSIDGLSVSSWSAKTITKPTNKPLPPYNQGWRLSSKMTITNVR